MANYVMTPMQAQTPWYPGRTYTIGAYINTSVGLALNDTITFQNAVTPSGIIAIDAQVRVTQLDSNASPLGKYSLGDSTSGDANAAGRFITGGNLGSNAAGVQLVQFSNVTPTVVSGVQTKGAGYQYFTDENSSTNEAGGFLDLVLTVTTAPATAASSGTVWVYFTYYCVGNP